MKETTAGGDVWGTCGYMCTALCHVQHHSQMDSAIVAANSRRSARGTNHYTSLYNNYVRVSTTWCLRTTAVYS